MKLFPRTLGLVSLVTLLALPLAASAAPRDGGSSTHSVDSNRGDRRGGSDRDRGSSRRGGDRSSNDRGDRGRSDARRGSSSRRSDSSYGRSSSSRSYGNTRTYESRRSYHHNHRSTRVVVQTPRVVVTPPRVVVRSPRVVVGPDPRYIEPMYMNGPALDRILWDLQSARFESERLDILFNVSRNYTMHTGQVRAMVAQLRFADSRVDALAAMYPRVRDKQNWYTVYDLLTFSSDRRELRARTGY